MRSKKPLFTAIFFLVFMAGTVQAAPACGLDIFSLDAMGGNVTFFLYNTGLNATPISFQVKVNGETAFTGNTTLNTTETVKITNNVTFSPGTYTIAASASSVCNATDSETITLTLFPSFSCTSPVAHEGQDRCEPQIQSYMVCEGGGWVGKARNTERYCATCGLTTCGDGILNCGETETTCPKDALLCREEYTGNSRCSGGFLQREVRNLDCSTRFVEGERCVSGCAGDCFGEPVTGCSVFVKGLTYQTAAGASTATFTIQNTGIFGHIATVRVLLDNVFHSTSTIPLFSSQEAARTVTIATGSGSHSLQVTAAASCGATDSRTASFTIAAPPVVREPLQFPSFPLNTSVSIFPETVDMRTGDARAFTITIQSARHQQFLLSITGLPPEWLDFTSVLNVEGNATTYLTLLAEQSGLYHPTVQIVAAAENKTFTFPIEVFVASPPSLFTAAFIFDDTAMEMLIVLGGVIALALLVAYRDDLRFWLLETRWKRILASHRIRRL